MLAVESLGRLGAEAILRSRTLLRASQRDTAQDGQELLRAAQGGAAATPPTELLRAVPEASAPPETTRTPGFLARLFRRD